jgi:glutamine amidotransferase/cyclase
MSCDFSIINYGAGNIRSLVNFLKACGFTYRIIEHPKEIASANRLILPGVGSFGAAIDILDTGGFSDEILDYCHAREKPLLGICLGMQLLCESSEESPLKKGISLLSGKFEKISSQMGVCPHIGYNSLRLNRQTGLFKGLGEAPDFYFCHSFHLDPMGPIALDTVIATVNHGSDMVACVAEKNVVGVQFHPEKSVENGRKFIGNFKRL